MTQRETLEEICAAEVPLHTIQHSLAELSGKWTLRVLFALWSAPTRFLALHRAIPGVSKHVLTTTLRDLERAGLVQREVEASVPPRVTYSLTSRGEALQPVFASIIAWAGSSRGHGT